ncbi:MarR family transcriptional regulator [bacterium]|nr:MAG: MarR family transcriptional regulator [bacterium]
MSNRELSTDLLESPGYQLWLATNAWQRMVRTGLEPLGVTHAQHAVLTAVKRLGVDGEPVTQADVCRFGSLDPNMASQVIRCLEQRELLLRLPHPSDGRAYQLRLTEPGMALCDACKSAIKPLIDDFFAPLGEDKKELARMLRIINNAVD